MRTQSLINRYQWHGANLENVQFIWIQMHDSLGDFKLLYDASLNDMDLMKSAKLLNKRGYFFRQRNSYAKFEFRVL